MLPSKRFKQTVLNFGRVYPLNESAEATAGSTSDPITTTSVALSVGLPSEGVTSESDVVSELQTTLSPPVDICSWTTGTTRTVCKPILSHVNE